MKGTSFAIGGTERKHELVGEEPNSDISISLGLVRIFFFFFLLLLLLLVLLFQQKRAIIIKNQSVTEINIHKEC